jgi:hypothetical protein
MYSITILAKAQSAARDATNVPFALTHYARSLTTKSIAIGNQLSALRRSCRPVCATAARRLKTSRGQGQLRKTPRENCAQHVMIRRPAIPLALSAGAKASEYCASRLRKNTAKPVPFATHAVQNGRVLQLVCDFLRQLKNATRCQPTCYNSGQKTRCCKTLSIPRIKTFCTRASRTTGAKPTSGFGP